MAYSKRTVDLTGKRFGFLVVLSRAGTHRTKSHRLALWRCRCDCGQEVIAWARRLRNGKRKACGVNGHHWRLTKGTSLRLIHPGEYRSWRGMFERCEVARDAKSLRNYKSRGIKVCARWKTFAAFFEDMGPRPTSKHSIDRYPDNNGDYKPDNCRWATAKEQTRNMRHNIFVEYQGEKMLLIDVAERVGLNGGVVYGRIKNGWSLADALSIPVLAKNKTSPPPPTKVVR